ncbi:MAG: PilZ domain-containing protein [Sandaracinaceae bacterium]
MLQRVEVIPGHRRHLRRAVTLDVDVIAPAWSARRKHRALDVSPEGIRLAAGTRLPVDSHVVVSFTPPGWWIHGELSLFARVRSSEPRDGRRPAWFGLSFEDMPRGAAREIERALVGVPPPLPRRRPRTELVWVDRLMTWEEDLGDRVNVFEVSEALMPLFDGMFEPTALAPLLSA